MGDVFGPLVDNDDVETAVTLTIEYWADSYLAAKERAKSWTVGTLSRPASYNQTYDIDNWPEGQLPAVLVVCPGTVGEPLYYQQVSAWFEVNVDLVVAGQTEAEARRVAAAYASAMATLLTQQGDLKGSTDTPFAIQTRFVSWRIELPDVSNRTLAVGSVQVHTLVEDIFDPSTAPLLPPGETDPGDWPTVATTDLTFQADPLNESPA